MPGLGDGNNDGQQNQADPNGDNNGQNQNDPQGNNGDGNGSGDNQATNWRDDLIPKEIREDKIFADIKTPQEAMKMLHSAQKMIGKEKVPIPGPDSPAEEWDAFYKAGGRPEAVEGYELPEGWGDEEKGMFDAEGLKAFQKVAFENGMSAKGFQEAVSWYKDYMSSVTEAHSASVDQQIADGLDALKKEWRGEDYTINMGVAEAALEQLGDDDLTELIMGDKALRNNPAIIKLFHRIGSSMQDHQPLQGLNSGGLKVDNITHAKQELAAFDAKYKDVLTNPNYQGPLITGTNRDAILEKRFKLTQQATAGGTRGVDGNNQYTEFEVNLTH